MFVLNLRKALPSPDELISAGSGLSSIDVPTGTSSSFKPLPARTNLVWERAILRKLSIENVACQKYTDYQTNNCWYYLQKPDIDWRPEPYN